MLDAALTSNWIYALSTTAAVAAAPNIDVTLTNYQTQSIYVIHRVSGKGNVILRKGIRGIFGNSGRTGGYYRRHQQVPERPGNAALAGMNKS